MNARAGFVSNATSRLAFERFLTESEEKKLMVYVRRFGDILAKRDYAWMRFMRQTGIRINSLAMLNVGDARTAKARGFLRIRNETAKGGRGYDVKLNERDALPALDDLLSIRRKMGGMLSDDAPLILGRRGERISVRSLQARMQQWVAGSGLSVRASPHWWRHTMAKRYMARSESKNALGVVQILLGHRSITSTGIYVLPDRQEVSDAMELIA